MSGTPYKLRRPSVRSTSAVFASPHSGRDYDRAFLRKSVLDERTLRSSEDAFVDLLFESAPDFGAPLLAATAPRAFIDLNRSPCELDPALIENVRESMHNPRVASGLGVIPRVVANGRSIYGGRIGLAEASERLRSNWMPYHDCLQRLLDETRRQFGEAILIDCHSMPHEAIESILMADARHPEIVLGDRFGAAADREIVDRIEAAFASAGLGVVRNAPFAGAYTAQQYGRPLSGQHVIQVEIDRSLYMNERLVRPSRNFKAFQQLIRSVVGEIAGIGRREWPSMAAE